MKSGGVPVLQRGGVSLEADCSGRLWVYDVFTKTVFEVESGETGWCVNDIPWLSEDPTSGTVPGLGRRLPAGRRRQHAAGDGDVRLGGPPPGSSPAVAGLHDGHADPVRSGAGRLHRPLRRRAGGQLRLELHLRRGGARRHAGLQSLRAGVRVLSDRGRDAPQHGRIHRARGARRAHAAARVPGRVRRRAPRQLQRGLHRGTRPGRDHGRLQRRSRGSTVRTFP